jgi:hypothetical protein
MELTELQEIINRHGRNLNQEIGLALSEQEAKDIIKSAVSEVFSLHVVSGFSSEQMKEAYRDGFENDHPNEWDFDINNYR